MPDLNQIFFWNIVTILCGFIFLIGVGFLFITGIQACLGVLIGAIIAGCLKTVYEYCTRRR